MALLDGWLYDEGLAEELGCSVRQIYRLKDRRELPPHVVIAGRRRYDPEALPDWLARRMVVPRQGAPKHRGKAA